MIPGLSIRSRIARKAIPGSFAGAVRLNRAFSRASSIILPSTRSGACQH